MFSTVVLALASIIFIFLSPAEAATINVNCPPDNLQAAIDSALPGDTISITGTCTGNFLVRNDKVRVFIQPSGAALSATINGGASGTALDIRGKAISVTNMIILGGTNGIVIQRGANAVLDGNVVRNATNNGITVTSLAFAVIINNVVNNNGADGIAITESSDARIGWNNSTNGPAAGNDIYNNGDHGIIVSRSSAARITTNNIFKNFSHGISAAWGSHIDASNNQIDENSGDGIFVTGDSSLQSGGDPGIFALANGTNITNNAGFGIRCTAGGALNGLIGTLTGDMNPTSIDASCPNSLSP